MTTRIKPIRIPSDVSQLPLDYPFGDRVSESLEEYAKRQGLTIGAVKKRADRGQLAHFARRPGRTSRGQSLCPVPESPLSG